jgi:hypothetical protein
VVFTPFSPSSVGVTVRTGPVEVTLTVVLARFALTPVTPNALVSKQAQVTGNAASTRPLVIRIGDSFADA